MIDEKFFNNPYIYLGPLDPVKNREVLVPRESDLARVVNGLREGKYWAILGPREIGKTTFIRQVIKAMPECFHIFLNFQVSPEIESLFYRDLVLRIVEAIPAVKLYGTSEEELEKIISDNDPRTGFLRFLRGFTPKEDKNIVLHFDEVDTIPKFQDFSKVWRSVNLERFSVKNFDRFRLVITGAAEAVSLTTGAGAPFNMVERLLLKDFNRAEVKRLIKSNFDSHGIFITPRAEVRLITALSGHPKMTQHALFKLVETAVNEKREIREEDVDDVIEYLLVESSAIMALEVMLKEDMQLEQLLRSLVFKETPKRFFEFRDYAIKGPGVIIQDKGAICKIRNEVFKKYVRDSVDPNGDDRFQDLELIGKGGMGEVYRATDTLLDRTVAVKKITRKGIKTKYHSDRFFKEARAVAKLSHKNIVRVHDLEKIDDDIYIVMELIEGTDYRKILAGCKYLDIFQVLWVGRQLFSALRYSHQKNVVHRDIKPSNIVRESSHDIKVIDFGLAAALDEEKDTEYGSGENYIIGSFHYMSPEVLQKKRIDHRTDIYSAGVTLFQLVTGILPFPGKNKNDVIKGVLMHSPPPILDIRPDVPLELVEFINKCMKKNPELRYRDSAEALSVIERMAKDLKRKKKEQPIDYTQTERISYSDITELPTVPEDSKG